MIEGCDINRNHALYISMKGDSRQALADMVHGLRDTFKQYDKGTRTKAWKAIQSGAGKSLIDSLLTNPSKPIVGLPRLLHFKEWLTAQS